jgi:hypothetical protein
MIDQKWQANGCRCLSFADREGVRDLLASFGEQVKRGAVIRRPLKSCPNFSLHRIME